MPVTTPAPSTVANDVLLLLHEPPDEPFVSIIDDPMQTDAVPAIAAGAGVTVTIVAV